MNTIRTFIARALQHGAAGAPHAAPIIDSPCMPAPALPPLHAPHGAPGRRRGAAGFTLIELMITMSVAGVLSSVAYPSFVGQVHKVRRSDAVVAMMQLQWAQERWRSNNPAYGSLADIGMNAASPARYYSLQVSASSASGYDVVATATGTQSRDTACAVLKLSMQGANAVYTSGPDANAANAADVNRQCWSL